MESYLLHLLFSIPSLKAISFGNGIESSKMKGSEYIDLLIDNTGKTKTNNSGGINGGISNGNQIYFRTFFHPPVTMKKEYETFDFDKNQITKSSFSSRYDICHILRIPTIIDTCCAIILVDLLLINNSIY